MLGRYKESSSAYWEALMGIARGAVKLMMREGKRERYRGRVLTAGRQELFATSDNLEQWAQEMGYVLVPGWKNHLHDKEETKKGKAHLTDEALFLAFGFEELESMDYSNYEGCTIVHDLNRDVPIQYHDRYDLIFDAGTSEHIFDLPKVLENYNKMLKRGGRIVHLAPSSNHVDHGFYMFSPTLFSDYYSSNNWKIKDSLFVQYSPKHDKDLWNIYYYQPGCLDRYSFGGLKKGMYGIFFVATKTSASSFDADVQQGRYRRVWSKNDQSTELGPQSILYLQKIARRLPRRIREVIRPYYGWLLAKVPLTYHLKLVARY
jgi:SAM-dependent methyltransferase